MNYLVHDDINGSVQEEVKDSINTSLLVFFLFKSF